jgi:hypothetical protein
MKTIKSITFSIMLFIGLLLTSSCEKDSSTNPPPTSCSSTCSSVQCSGITQAGDRCQRMTTACCGRCWQHD